MKYNPDFHQKYFYMTDVNLEMIERYDTQTVIWFYTLGDALSGGEMVFNAHNYFAKPGDDNYRCYILWYAEDPIYMFGYKDAYIKPDKDLLNRITSNMRRFSLNHQNVVDTLKAHPERL